MMLKLAIAALLVMNVTSFYLGGNPCPPGVPMVMCNSPPCGKVLDRICKETFCGTCKANCYDKHNNPIECTYESSGDYVSGSY